MDSRISFWIICFFFFATCIRQGYARRKQAIEVDGTVEAGSNITNVLQKIILSDGKIVIEQNKPENSGNYQMWQKTVQNALVKYLFGTKNEQNFPTPSDGKIVIEQNKPENSGNFETWQETIQNALLKYLFGTKNEPNLPTSSGQSSGRSGLWSAAEALISDLAVALASNPDGQAIVQPSILDNQKYSLLQDMRSGRIRGPAHVYGRHVGIGRSGESSDDD